MDIVGIYLRTEWMKKFGSVYLADQRQTKTLCLPNGEKLCDVTYSPQLEQWYQSDQGKARYAQPECFFCEGHDQFQRLEKIVESDHLKIYFNVKFVTPFHFLVAPTDCREHPTPEDILALQKLAINADLAIIGNFRDSGAGYPKHVHYQTLSLVFPITGINRDCIESSYSLELEKVRSQNLVFRFHCNSENTRKRRMVAWVCAKAPKPLNLLFCKHDIYLAPRTKSVPFNTNGFKFAAAEVFGHVFVRTRKMFDDLNSATMIDALNDVCLVAESNLAKDYESRLLECVKEAYNAV